MKNENVGYKVTHSDFKCRGFKFELGKVFEHKGEISVCTSGFHFCLKPQDCFNYYDFTSENRVFEIQYGEIITEGDKSVTNTIEFVREIEWSEVLKIVNLGRDNTGHSNSGNWNSGNRNSGNWNSGNRNSGNRNSGYRNSGNWNSGNRNSGDSNSGYRNSGAFCTEDNPVVWLFDQPTDIKVRDWENSQVYRVMTNLNPNIWIDISMMSDEQKKSNPSHETTGGFLKSIPMKEAWSNMWGNLDDSKKELFKELPNFDGNKFKEITGIKID